MIKKRFAYRALAASVLFILFTAARLALPAQTAPLRREVNALVSRDADLEGAARWLSEGIMTLTAPLRALDGSAEEEQTVEVMNEYRPVTLMELREERAALLPKQTPEPTPEPVESDPAPQSPESGEELPSNVSAERPEPAFEYGQPVANCVSSGFGYRLHPIAGEVRFHYGTDYAQDAGWNVRAFADGTVRLFGWDEGYGNYVIIDHADGWSTLYAHCSIVYVTGGEAVSRGDVVALVGATGEVTGPHLHFELMRDGVYYDPERLDWA